MQELNTIIIGAGHSGLAVSYYLTQKGVNHLILEKGKIAQTWRTKTWDSLRMVLPNWMTQLPGFHYSGPNPNGFDSKQDYIKYLEKYAKSFQAPVQEGVTVRSLEKAVDQFLVKTGDEDFKSKNVVVATGGLQKVKIPNFANKLSQDITQLVTTEYRNPSQLKKGGVLIVGSGNSGVQIAEELLNNGFTVYLSVSKCRHISRNYRGKDAIHWLQLLGKLDVTVDSLPNKESQKVLPLLMTGQDNGRDLNLHELAKKGVRLLGKVTDVKGTAVTISSDLKENLDFADSYNDSFTKMIDEYIEQNNLDAPATKDKKPKPANVKLINELDLREANVKTVIWATGFYNDFSWIKIPDVLDQDGEPIQTKGVSKVSGLYFIGLKWLSKYKSNFIYGVGEDAQFLSEHIRDRD